MRARVLKRKEEDLKKARCHLRRTREANKERYDLINRVRDKRVKLKTLVLLYYYNINIDISRSKKLAFKQVGPYRVRDCIEDRGIYLFKELDGT